jgi:GxxExxY protein
LGAKILDACIEVHKEPGPGLLESVYIYALRKELELRNIRSTSEIVIPLFYKGYDTGKHYKIDLLIEEEIILEAKAVEIMHPVYPAQIISHLKLTDKCPGYLVNFNVVKLKDGFKRYSTNSKLCALRVSAAILKCKQTNHNEYNVVCVPFTLSTFR